MSDSTIRVVRFDPRATLPTRAHDTDAGLDLFAVEGCTIPHCGTVVFDIKVGFELPEGCYGQIFGRSSLAGGSEKLHTLPGIFPIGGVIDHKYRGSVKVALCNLSGLPYEVKAGDKIAQLVIIHIETPQPVEVLFLDDTERGTNGFGSTGR